MFLPFIMIPALGVLWRRHTDVKRQAGASCPTMAAMTGVPPMHCDTRENWHTRPIANLTAQFGTNVQQGLTLQEAAQRLQQGGPNEIRKEQAVSALTLLAGQFGNLVIWVLMG